MTRLATQQTSINVSVRGRLQSEALRDLPTPPWLIDGNLLDNAWTIRLDNTEGRRNTTASIRFDVSLLPTGERLTSAHNQCFLLLAKLYVYHLIREQVTTTADTAVGAGLALITFLRWLRRSDLSSLATLNDPEVGMAWFDAYCAQLRSGGPGGLLDADRRLETFLLEVRAGRRDLPYFVNTFVARPVRLFRLDTVAELCALSTEHIIHRPPFLMQILDLAVLRDLHLTPIQKTKYDQWRASGIIPRVDHARTHIGLVTYLKVWSYLRDLSLLGHLEHDPLTFKAFDQQRTVSSVARSLETKKPGRTQSAPGNQTTFLIDRALRWVVDYAPDLRIYFETIRGFENRIGNKSNRNRTSDTWTVVETALRNVRPTQFKVGATGVPLDLILAYQTNRNAVRKSRSGTTLRDALFVHLPVAAAIVIAAFSVSVREQIESLESFSRGGLTGLNRL